MRVERCRSESATREARFPTVTANEGAEVALNARASGPDLDQLRRVPRRICVVAGLSKLQSLRGALAAGLVTDLVIEEPLARALAQ